MCSSCKLVGGAVLHAAPKDASQDCQCRIGYGDLPLPLAICQQLSAWHAGTGCGVGKLMGYPASVELSRPGYACCDCIGID